MQEEEQELWKTIEKYENYNISNFGRVINNKTDKIMKLNNKGGYLNVSLVNSQNKKCFKVHRLVALAFIDNLENKSDVNHKDKNKSNNKFYFKLRIMAKKELKLPFGTLLRITAMTSILSPICAKFRPKTFRLLFPGRFRIRRANQPPPGPNRILSHQFHSHNIVTRHKCHQILEELFSLRITKKILGVRNRSPGRLKYAFCTFANC
jgi:hypothetical protein